MVTRRHTPRGTALQVRARREKVAEWTLAGYTVEAIAEALGILPTLVASDRSAMKARLKYTTKKTWRSPRPAEPLEKFDWKAAQPDDNAPPPVYVLTSPMRHVQSMYAQLTDTNALNRLAHNVVAARAAGDARWLARSQRQLETTIGYLTDMLDILTDEGVRWQAASSVGSRDDMAQRSLDLSPQSQPLPERGVGILPSTTMAWVWRWWYAGIPITDEVIGDIARKLNATRGRIQRAVKEFEARYQEE